MPLLGLIKDYWAQILFVCAIFGGMYKFATAMIEATKCSLRNDILEIYDECKKDKRITKWQFQAIHYSYEQYKKLKGNSFVEELIKQIDKFEIID